MMLPDMLAGMIAIQTGAKGPNFGVSSACATAGHALGEAAEIIRRGDADVMIAGGSEAPITRIGLAAFDSMRALSRRNDEPERASRPFDRRARRVHPGRSGRRPGPGDARARASSAARASTPSSSATARPPTPTTSPRPVKAAKAPRGPCGWR